MTRIQQTPMLGYLLSLISIATLTGCPKDDPKVDPSAQTSASTVASNDRPAFQITGTPASASAAPSAAPSAVASVAPTTTTTATAKTTPATTTTTTAVASVAPPAPSPTTPPAPTAKTVSSHTGGKNFGVDASSSGCKAGDTCVVAVRLNVTGEFHVNKEYPYKFIAAANPAVQYTAGDNTFSRANGDFQENGEKAATMMVKFKAKSAGDTNVSGTFKLSVCSADQCQIDQANVSLTVPVM